MVCDIDSDRYGCNFERDNSNCNNNSCSNNGTDILIVRAMKIVLTTLTEFTVIMIVVVTGIVVPNDTNKVGGNNNINNN